MESFEYQLWHPWHWLTYGQNAAATAALFALLGTIGLFFYVEFTRRLTLISQNTLRASITPVLIMRSGLDWLPVSAAFQPDAVQIGLSPAIVKDYQVVLEVRNIGEGPALFLQAWARIANDNFGEVGKALLSRSDQVITGVVPSSELLKGEVTKICFQGVSTSQIRSRWLFVVDTVDQAQGKHQLQILRYGDAAGKVKMGIFHATDNSVGERILRVVGRTVQIAISVREKLQHLDEAFDYPTE